MPGTWFGIALLPMTIVPLVMQPDIGQTMLLSVVWATLFYLAGLHMFWVFGLAGFSAAGLGLAYMFFPHVTNRINRFLDKGRQAATHFRWIRRLRVLCRAVWFGKGPGEGTIKRILPDSHTDFFVCCRG